ncbi:MAG: hypothetical protein CL885_04710 [Dehalococcoidia bacterium]|nr:hypothetical protein [Dehalococcoidia bacterium]|tara:strand:- start:887 stop:1291 length:405 start_codon:yes stop_codon:yes gene_type:complete
MQFKTLTGAMKRLSKPQKYKIDWSAPSRSKIQFKVKKLLEKHWSNHVVFEEFPVAGTRLSFDFYNANKKIAIEVQGEQHTKYVPHFHGKNKINFFSQMRRDQQKREFCEINQIKLIEIYSTDELSPKTFKSVIS